MESESSAVRFDALNRRYLCYYCCCYCCCGDSDSIVAVLAAVGRPAEESVEHCRRPICCSCCWFDRLVMVGSCSGSGSDCLDCAW